MNRQIRLVGVGLMALFVVLFVQLNYLQVDHATALDHNPLNGDAVVKQYDQARGAIVSADGVTLAYSVPAPAGSSFRYQRRYPTGALFGQVTGYYSFVYGSTGVENSYNAVLTGTKRNLRLDNLSDLRRLLTDTTTAQNVTLTLSDRLQTVARAELAGQTGSVVALDPATGAVLAMYSNPTYNPTGVSSLSTTAEERAWKAILATPGQPLVPGAYGNRWPPGSTFKTITAGAVYDHQPGLATKVYPYRAALPLPQTTTELHNFGGESCGGALLELFTVSCDTGFGQVGLDLGAASLYAEATAFGFDSVPPLDLPGANPSTFPAVASFDQALPTLAYSAIGQEDVQATPLQMALVAAGIADGGRIMTPHVLGHVTDAQNTVVSTYKPKLWLQATSAATAAQLTTLMESVVASPDGTGGEARIPGVTVAAKTGTAQTGTGGTDDWFIAFAPAQHPTIAVAVVLPDKPAADEYQGGTLAAPIARAMIEADLAGTTLPAATTTTLPGVPATAPPATTPASPTTVAPVAHPTTTTHPTPTTPPPTATPTTPAPTTPAPTVPTTTPTPTPTATTTRSPTST